MMESLESLISLYKKDKITDYVVERELSLFLGMNVHVRITTESMNAGGKSFVLFAIPEKLTEGFVITIFVDKYAIQNFYTAEEFEVLMNRFKKKIQTILRRYFQFLTENDNNDITYNYALGFLLSLYSLYRGDLIISNDSFLVDEADLLKLADKFSLGDVKKEDMEAALINNMINGEIAEFIKRYVRVSGELKFVITDDTDEKPSFNVWQKEILNNVTSSYGIRNHKEIPYDYLPKTNQ